MKCAIDMFITTVIKLYSVVTCSGMYSHTQFQVVSFSNPENKRDFSTFKFAVYNQLRHLCFI